MKIYFKPFLYLLSLYVAVCTILRIILISQVPALSFKNVTKIFLIGTVENVLVFAIASFFLWIYLLFISDKKYQKPYGYIIFGFLVLLLFYLIFCNNLLKQYGSVLPEIGIAFVSLKTVLFGIILFFPKLKKSVRYSCYFVVVILYVTSILLNAVSEYFFWGEFGTRYNFIAVDYLVYTTEVIGNIFESYPIMPLFSILFVAALSLSVYIFNRSKGYIDHLPSLAKKIKISLLYTISLFIAVLLLPLINNDIKSGNQYANELRNDGPYQFFKAFSQNHLSYNKFYPVISKSEAYNEIKNQVVGIKNFHFSRSIQDSFPEEKKNIVLISVESLSASYLRHFGNKEELTPFLDSLADEGLLFTNLYATGNRTVRGLEALTLCMPPTPGESIIKQTNNANLFTIGTVLRNKSYSTTFLYGGYSYFDNMKAFYTGNGYKIVDRSNLNPKDITFSNVWGVCDEDMAKECVRVMNKQYFEHTPFFCHWMTVSNHRPFTYPPNKIDISPDSKSRAGGVKYTDYALKKFFHLAQQQPWFNNTVFIIVADHCASSSGKVELPVEKYHIPAIVYSPNFLMPKQENVLMSQIDLMPTVFGLLHFSYKTTFFGENVFSPAYVPRTFLATYQSLGYMRDSILTVLSPPRNAMQYHLKFKMRNGAYESEEVLLKTVDTSLKNQAIGFYQTTADMRELKNK